MLIRDIYDANANSLLAKLRGELGKVQAVRASAKEGGDYEETLGAYVRTLHSAIDAVGKQVRVETERAT